MFYILLCSIAMSLLLLVAWLKAKADNSFLEGKAADFLDRERRWMKEVEMLKAQLVQFPSNSYQPYVPKAAVTVPAASKRDEWVPPSEAEPEYHFQAYEGDPREMQTTELGNVTMAFLQKIGVNLDQMDEPTQQVAPEDEMASLEQTIMFEESEFATLSTSSLNHAGIHYWEGSIEQKFSDDFALISNGSYHYHLTHEKLSAFQKGDKVCLQVLVSQSENASNRDVLMVWAAENPAVISA
ncbi:hypothetical protein [Cohnella sp. AR92]|uniref:hypothetical protein n=1 Tax=Cohnella sp. AR92 TaxID=648716 RepID=UPI000F8EFEEA|nr:hypothetical protein [Cohnella sp. AR92]RUS44909.1 hypothetical protein ELR57_21875 [Cohnella sp. AR92]